MMQTNAIIIIQTIYDAHDKISCLIVVGHNDMSVTDISLSSIMRFKPQINVKRTNHRQGVSSQ